MSVTVKDVEYIATLARLEFNDSEKQHITKDLNSILGYIETLNKLDTSAVEPLANMGDRTNVLREDEPKGSIPNTDALKNAPDAQDRFFKVPKVLG
jgi:aspartyl-tRNA(Asn)/glutamyl-tRNA(Gln) amidotransferase subunit C